ncbi:hypothetical protein K466DRAFT_568484 [Polyporus arcularius HHB13444]|uniref:Uncharacterized protein n=1 Tax=Polyporus arcularius HHB13444 TaxID=1314778 RepID=A0A5C3P974_9APHY|nr:hypothetical protein K466DRAFT_568484 [Polyporus arcularius HHB13444]
MHIRLLVVESTVSSEDVDYNITYLTKKNPSDTCYGTICLGDAAKTYSRKSLRECLRQIPVYGVSDLRESGTFMEYLETSWELLRGLWGLGNDFEPYKQQALEALYSISWCTYDYDMLFDSTRENCVVYGICSSTKHPAPKEHSDSKCKEFTGLLSVPPPTSTRLLLATMEADKYMEREVHRPAISGL